MKSRIVKGLKWLGGLMLLLAVGLGWIYTRDLPAPDQPQGEQITAEEAVLTPAIIGAAIRLSSGSRDRILKQDPQWGQALKDAPAFNPETYRRDVHSKTHGCAAATFTVAQPLPDSLRIGLFAKAAAYPAWIRFSNGTSLPSPDSKNDARGFAMKVMNVPGAKLLPGEESDTTQDFLMINSSTFFIRTIQEYAEFGDALGEGREVGYFFGHSLNPLKWKLRQFQLAMGTLKPAPDNLLNERYYSLSAYALGPDQFVKYSVRPCRKRSFSRPDRSTPDFLRTGLAKDLEADGACFEFMVQQQVAGVNMPVEDATVEWPESKAPFRVVATLELPKQTIGTEDRQRFCENLSFNPWHALPEHRPAGVMNRVRKALYHEMSKFRRCKNERSFLGEPRGTQENPWALDFDCKPCEQPGLGQQGDPRPGGCNWRAPEGSNAAQP